MIFSIFHRDGHCEVKQTPNGAVDLTSPTTQVLHTETTKSNSDVTNNNYDVIKNNCDIREVTSTPESTATCESGSHGNHLMAQSSYTGTPEQLRYLGTPTPEQLQQGFESENLLPEKVKMPKGGIIY